ncbi:MAG: AmmeMemoRadiSam system protein B [Phycisphaerales bacterium]|nr:MAG: AmmeMemoRadiSam system protein B [Phycisphaerales bacterium]
MHEQPPAEIPPFDPNAPHMNRPKLRPIRGFAFKQEEQPVLGLADARQVSDKIVYTSPAAQLILPHMTGEHDIDAIISKVNDDLKTKAPQAGPLQREMLERFVAQLDDAALLEGPTFDSLLAKVRADFDSSPTLPPSVTATIADMLVQQSLGEQEATDEQKREMGPEKLRDAFDQWIAQALKDAPDPSFDTLPKAIVAPHLDYPRGWMNYANVYGRMRVVDRPDRVIILGTNHFGHATGVCACDKGFETPLGVSRIDDATLNAMRERLGSDNATRLFEHRYDHEREHSIELHVAWIQHVFAPADPNDAHVPIFAALVHDPVVKSGDSYDGQGLALAPFVEALKETIAALPGRTLVVASADLSHVGPQFGDQVSLGGDKSNNPQGVAKRDQTIQHDRRMIEMYAQRRPDDLIAAMAWQKNPTRWCSIGNLVATMKAVEPEEVRVLNYGGAMDQQGAAMVTSCAAAMF